MRSFRLAGLAVALSPALAACDGVYDPDGLPGDPAAGDGVAVETTTERAALTGATTCGGPLADHFAWMAAGGSRWVSFRLVEHEAPSGFVRTYDGSFSRYSAARFTLRCTHFPTFECTSIRVPASMSGTGRVTLSERAGVCAAAAAATVTLEDNGRIVVNKESGPVTVSNVECLDGNFYGVGSDRKLYSMSLFDQELL